MYTRILALLVILATIVPLSPFSNSRAQRTGPSATGGRSHSIPTPQEVLGFTPGDDRKLASWASVVDYFKKLDAASDRVMFEELGKSTMGAPFVMATISAPENLSRLEEYKSNQEELADPRKLGPVAGRDRKAAALIAHGKTVVLITCGIHST